MQTKAANKIEIIEELSRDAKLRPYTSLSILALAGVTFFFGLGRLALVGPDEPRYAEVAREMFVTGDYISTRLCGCLWFEKPALLYWLAAAAYHVFGVSEFSARLPSALAAVGTAAFIYYALRRTVSEALGFLVSLVLITSAIFIGFARASHMDMLLAAAMSVAIMSGYLSTAKTGKARLGYLALCWAAAGVAVLAKGLVGIFLVIAILAIYLAITGRLKLLGWQQVALGLVIFLAVATVWYLPVTLKHGWLFIDQLFINHHFNRYVSNQYGHPQPIYFYPLVALAGVLPWVFFLIPAAIRLRSLRPRSDERDALLALAWVWAAVPLVFFSFSESKLPGYILPIFPALAIIIGAEVERMWSGERARMINLAAWMTAILLVAIGVSFLVYLRQKPISITGWRWALYLGPLILSLIAVVMLGYAKRHVFIAAIAAVVSSVIVGTVILLFPTLNDEISLKSLSLQVASELRPGEKIGFYVLKEFAPVFYTEGRVVCQGAKGTILNALAPESLSHVLETESSLVVIARSRWARDLESNPAFHTEEIGNQGDVWAYRVQLRDK